MFGVSGDGLHDRLVEFSRADTGSYLFAPGASTLAEAIGSESGAVEDAGSESVGLDATRPETSQSGMPASEVAGS